MLKILLMILKTKPQQQQQKLYSDSISGQSESVKVKLYNKLYQYCEQLFQRLELS